MKQHKEILILNSLEKAHQALSDSKYALEGNRLDNAQNRIYYAIFYSVTALAYLNEFVTSKHSQLMGWFNKKFIYENNIFGEELLITYKISFENRTKSDYEISYKPDKEKVIENFKNAEIFVKEIEKYIKDQIKK